MKSMEKIEDSPKRVCYFHVYVFAFMKIFY